MNMQVDTRNLLNCVTDAIPLHDAEILTAGGNLAHILLNGQVYSLRITRAGKLILTK